MNRSWNARPALLALTVAAALAVATPAGAANLLPYVTHASVNDTGTVITLHGQNFMAPKGGPKVLVSGYSGPITITNVTPTSITALLPVAIPPGTYAVTVGSGVSSVQQAGEGLQRGSVGFAKLIISLGEQAGFLALLFEQAHILDGYSCCVGHCLKQLDV